jgi:ATP:corrinoid adenosyltransferase
MADKLLKSARDLYQGEEWFFQQDNVPCHTANRCKEWFNAHGVQVLSWPAQSPDLNPIENLWQQIKVLIARNKPTSKANLIEEIVKAWYRVITPERLESLVNSMPRRCKAVIASKGWPTKYLDQQQTQQPFSGPPTHFKEFLRIFEAN